MWYSTLNRFAFRQKLRRLEVALMEYRESLEEQGIKSPEEIELKVSAYRKRLESEYGLSDSSENAPRSKFFLSLEYNVKLSPKCLIYLLFLQELYVCKSGTMLILPAPYSIVPIFVFELSFCVIHFILFPLVLLFGSICTLHYSTWKFKLGLVYMKRETGNGYCYLLDQICRTIDVLISVCAIILF